MSDALHTDLQVLHEFYLEQRNNPPKAFSFAQRLVQSPSFFSVETLQAHINNPLLVPGWMHVVSGGRPVPLQDACFYKHVQDNQLVFMDKRPVDDALDQGAALVLEGIDILDPTVNSFVAKLEEALPCSLCNCVAFFSQRGNEAYEGHCDSDDVLVIQLSGKKLWNIYEPQQRRYADTMHLSGERLGPKIKQLTMCAGDALYVRAGVPHLCQTTGDHSLHLAFDLVDSTPNVRDITQQANEVYDRASEDPYVPPSRVINRYAEILQSPDFQGFVDAATDGVRDDIRRFRESIGNATGVRALSKFIQ